MNFKLKIWRQPNARTKGRLVTYNVTQIPSEASFLEMLDILNEQLILKGEDPVAFDSDCREGICGACGLFINGYPHGRVPHTTTCQLHMRHFRDGETIVVEPWRAKPFPVVKDLIVDRSAFDQIIQAGGYVSCHTGGAPEANTHPIAQPKALEALDAASCIGCGACVATCKNASAMLFVAAKVSHLALLPQGEVEALDRVRAMVAKMDSLGFGSCSNTYACQAQCPQSISVTHIARMNRQYLAAKFREPNK